MTSQSQLRRWYVPASAATRAWVVLGAVAALVTLIPVLAAPTRLVYTLVLAEALMAAAIVAARQLVGRDARAAGSALVAATGCLVISSGLTAAADAGDPMPDITSKSAVGFVPVVLGVAHLLLAYALGRVVVCRAHRDRKQLAGTVFVAGLGAVTVWAFVMAPQLHQLRASAPLVSSAVLLCTDGALLAVVLRLLRANGRRYAAALAVLALVVVSLAAADASVAGPVGWHLIAIPAVAGTLANLAAVALIATALLHPSARQLVFPAIRPRIAIISRVVLATDITVIFGLQIPILFFPRASLELRVQQLIAAAGVIVWLIKPYFELVAPPDPEPTARAEPTARPVPGLSPQPDNAPQRYLLIRDDVHPVEAIQQLPPFRRERPHA